MKQDLTDIVIQLTQLLNGVSIDTKIYADSIAVTLSDDNIIVVNNSIITVDTITVNNDHKRLSCNYRHSIYSENWYEIYIEENNNKIMFIEYLGNNDDEDEDNWDNKYTTLYLEGEWLVEPS